jgi:carbonic anhydrase
MAAARLWGRGPTHNYRETLAEASPVIGALVKEGKLLVAGGVYDLQTGRVTPVAL